MEEVQRIVPQYVDHMTALLRRLLPNAQLATQCRSLDEDFAAMLHSR